MINKTEILKSFEVDLANLADFMITDLKRELIDQGHILTGKLRDSIELLNVNVSSGSMEAFVGLENYFGALDTGVRASRIPYEPGSGKKTSKYIDGLIKFWMIKKGLGKEDATRAAFALARKHKKEGMPTQSSWIHSSNGRRLEFFSRTVEDSDHYDQFETNLQDELESISDQIINTFQKSLR